MSKLRDIAYRIDPALWVREVLGVEPDAVAGDISARAAGRLDHGADRAAGRQDHDRGVGDCAFHAVYARRILSVIACPAQRQSAEAVRRVREVLIKVGAELKSDNVYGLELKNGSRVLALPSSDDSIRGLTVDGWIVADEAARLPDDLIAALRPMRARRPQARFAMLSTAWSRTDPFWTAWASDDPSWIRLKATADTDAHFSPRNSSSRSVARSARMISSANISAFPAVERQVRSAGICMSARRRFTCPWCRLVRPFNRRPRRRRCRSPIRSNVCK